MANSNAVVSETKLKKQTEFPLTKAILPAIILLLALFNVLVTENFFALQSLWNLLILISTTALVAIGMTLVIATGGIDLSVGSIMAVAAVTSTFLLETNLFILVAGTLGVCLLFGIFNGAVISYIGVQPIIATLAMMIAGRGLAQVATEGYLISFSNPAYGFIGKGSIAGIPVPVLILFIVAALIYTVVKHTTFGRYVEAIGDNERAANLAGINVKLVKLIVYSIAAVLAALAGLIETSRLAAADATRIGELIELDAIAAVVVGGTLMTGGRPYIWGTVMGALLMGLITVTFIMNDIPHPYSLVIKAFIIIGAIFVQRKK
ncbi:ABC transporter permease [Thalassobacillus pellis]|uniref:ABC transporter permease n=1 Tax=Thalassobacillus pellis TaxID=748008 RepID=UPI00195F722A|nr:ABC transporter permease [Thalassobacillus pellis]MBM7551885.1 ribose/xylose/arabinose/galactoside ABC-type transport system permease subunit [Thalassobacillus pellis]